MTGWEKFLVTFLMHMLVESPFKADFSGGPRVCEPSARFPPTPVLTILNCTGMTTEGLWRWPDQTGISVWINSSTTCHWYYSSSWILISCLLETRVLSRTFVNDHMENEHGTGVKFIWAFLSWSTVATYTSPVPGPVPAGCVLHSLCHTYHSLRAEIASHSHTQLIIQRVTSSVSAQKKGTCTLDRHLWGGLLCKQMPHHNPYVGFKQCGEPFTTSHLGKCYSMAPRALPCTARVRGGQMCLKSPSLSLDSQSSWGKPAMEQWNCVTKGRKRQLYLIPLGINSFDLISLCHAGSSPCFLFNKASNHPLLPAPIGYYYCSKS